ncbi:MAG: NADH:ubiquinone reductase (Na(+)-transporting) subunit A, partial [Flavobacteriales bacterium]
YAVIADPSIQPKFINISSFNSEPLAADDSFMIEGKAEAFQKGIDALAKLTSGAVQLNLKGKGNNSTVFSQAKNCTINTVSGPHPAGNNGVQIHHLNPVNKNESVWYLRPQGVVAIGELLMTKSYNPTRLVAVCGEKASETSYVEAIQGAKAADLLAGASMDNTRLISGTVLTGQQIESEDSINFYANELTLIEEGNEAEFLGWVLPGLGKLSLSRTFFSWLNTKKKYSVNTNLHGEERAYVVTGQYERYLPMDIHPVHLVKAAMANDIELMENLGIYEVSPEDFALCEFACTSKIEVQQVIREALDLVKKELT